MVAGTTKAGARAAKPLEQSLEALRRLCAQHDGVESLLEEATQVILEVLGAASCAVVWQDEDKPTLRVRARRHRVESAAGNGQDAQVIAFVTRSGAAPAQAGELAAALRVGGRIVGYLYARSEAKRGRRSAGLDQALFEALAEHLAFAIETQTLRQLLASRYATIALSRDGQSGALDLNFLSAVTHPEKVARIIARSFYKDLRKAGFETKQILVVATELIDSLNVALRRTKAKTAESADSTNSAQSGVGAQRAPQG